MNRDRRDRSRSRGRDERFRDSKNDRNKDRDGQTEGEQGFDDKYCSLFPSKAYLFLCSTIRSSFSTCFFRRLVADGKPRAALFLSIIPAI